MILNQDHIDKIKEYASKMMTFREIAILLEIPYDAIQEEFMTDGSLASKAYLLGRTNTLLEMRTVILESAKRGSPNSELLAVELLNNQKLYENDIL